MLNIFSGVLIGFDRVIQYYRTIPAMVTPLYRGRVDNFSFYAVGWRFFEGTGSPIFDTLEADPLIYAPDIAFWVSVLLPLLALCFALYQAMKIGSFDVAFASMLCACVVCGPLAWRAYLTWLVIPLAIAAKLCLQEYKHRYLLVVVIILLVGYPTPLSLIANAFIQPGVPTAPFATTFFSFIPIGAVCGLFTLLIKLNSEKTKTEDDSKGTRRIVDNPLPSF